MSVYMADRRAKRRADLIALKGSKCQKCESTESLEFNHLDRTLKKFSLSGCHLDKAWKSILAEAEKCELVCKGCHLDYTRSQYASGEIQAHNKNLRPFVHGTMRSYQEAGCKCDPCRTAKKRYRNKELGYSEVVIM